MEAKLIAYIIFGMAVGLVASLFITPIFCFLRVVFFVPFARRKYLEKAKKDGHVVEAYLKKKHSLMPGDDNSTVTTPQEMGTYIYYVNGRKYKYRLMTDAKPGLDKTITLFYIKRPRKAEVGGNLGNREVPWIKSYLIISLIVTILAVVLEIMVG